MAFPLPLKRVIENLSRLPGLGEKSATRLALYLLGRPEEEIRELAQSLLELKEKIRLCRHCFNFAEDDLCSICSDPDRDPGLICVVEDPADLAAIEAAGIFRGHYHVLHGLLSPREGLGPREIRLEALLERLKKEPVREVLIALSPTVAGEATASYLVELLKDLPVQVTRLACGLALGMEVRYADRLTLKRALLAREKVLPS
ncbi:MAG: recombination protein RecR [Thermodesulfobacteria bacterium]|nr:recombination protein RecR [Thermodesulfobacteriota bacterium]